MRSLSGRARVRQMSLTVKSLKMKKHCCEDMTQHVNYECPTCESKYDCPDVIIYYWDKFNEYGIAIHDGGASSIVISFCPFCGEKLPDSKRDLWFDTLEKLGFDDPMEQDIPKQFLTDQWYR